MTIKIQLVRGQGFVDPHILVTPDIARQIVALSAVPAFEANTLQRLASIEDHCNRMLKLTQMALQNKETKMRVQEVINAEPFLGTAHQSDLEKAHGDDADNRDHELMGRDVEIAALRAQVAALERSQRVGGRAISSLGVQLGKAEAERDAARAELAALKGRKVKLPLMFGEPDRGDPPDAVACRKMYDDAIEACADAIRAAGITLEGE